jgi:hypothetical protein
MSQVDFAIAVSLFLFFFTAIIIFTANYFSRYSGLTKTPELEPAAESLFNVLLKRKGIPENWDLNYSVSPVKLGLMQDLYMIPIVVKESAGSSRNNEPVTVRITFDENCQNKSWNTTLRMYNESDAQINLEMSNTTFCSNSQFFNVTNITWEVTIPANQTKKYYLYYSSDRNVTNPNYIPLSYNTDSWIPNNEDGWTESTINWTDASWGSSSVSSNTTDSDAKKGSYSINIKGTSVNNWLRARYGEVGTWNVSEYKNIIFSFKVNDTLNNQFMIWLESTNGAYNKSFENNISSANTWYKITLPISEFNGSGNLEAIDNVTIGCFNNTNTVSFEFKVDDLHFEKDPLRAKVFPEEKIEAISENKFDVMRNLSYDELKKTIGENYKLNVRIDNKTYGGLVNQSANAVCYQNPSIIQYKNGTVKKIIPKLCVWK